MTNEENENPIPENEYRESFGEFLRRHREASGKTVEAISRTTRISKRFLQAFEDSDLAHLPEDAFARGFLRSYAMEVGMDVDECLSRYDRFRRSTMPTQVREVRKPKAMSLGGEFGESTMTYPKGLSVVLLSAVGLLILVVVAIIVLRTWPLGSSQSADPSLSTSEAGTDSASPGNEDAPVILEGPKAPGLPLAPAAQAPTDAKLPPSTPTMVTPVRPSVLAILAKKDAKITIRLDENALQEISLKQGETQTLNVFREIEIRATDKSAFALQYNGKALEVSGPVVKLFNRFLFQKKQ